MSMIYFIPYCMEPNRKNSEITWQYGIICSVYSRESTKFIGFRHFKLNLSLLRLKTFGCPIKFYLHNNYFFCN